MAIFSNIAGAEPSTVTFRVASVTIDRGSTTEHQEVLVLGDPESSVSIARVSSGAPASTDAGLVVRQVGYSTIVSVAAMPANSSLVQLNAIAAGYVSSAAPAANSSGLVVWPVGYSTVVTVAALPANSSQVEVRAMPAGSTSVTVAAITGPVSTAAPATTDTGLIVRQVGYSTIVTVAALPAGSTTVTVAAMPANSSVIALGSIAAGLISSAAPAHGSSALIVREVLSSLQSTTVTVTSSASTAVYTVLSSVAGNQRVYAYFIGASTSGNHSTVLLGSDTNPAKWGVVMSSGVWGANLAVNPSGFLFETGAGNPLNARIESASTAIVARFSLSYKVD